MDTVTLQIPMSKSLKLRALEVADSLGFSSLQEIVRVLLTKFADHQLVVKIEEPPVTLSEKASRRYLKMMEDFKTGKNVKTVNSVEELMADLRA